MNLLNNRRLLRRLLQQGDLLNTINGGVSMTNVVKQQRENDFTVVVSAPTLPAESYNVVINDRQLIIFSVLPNTVESVEDQLVNIPIFYKSFDLPAYIDIENIEAIHDDKELVVVLPFKESARYHKKIDIKHL